MIIALLGISSQEYLRLLCSDNLAFFSTLTCFLCGRRLWRNGFRHRLRPVPLNLIRLKCSGSDCSAHYTVYPEDILPRLQYHSQTAFALISACLASASGLEHAFKTYQHARETRIEDGKDAGPDVSTLRRWVKKFSDLSSLLSLLNSAFQMPRPCEFLIRAVHLTPLLPSQLLSWLPTTCNESSPKMPVTSDSNRANGCSSLEKSLNFYNQEHPP